ncbi:uncharacterized protein METZ01_LOCUS15555 [marine metagenome]|uniref:Uncharacterized protein n=1 Tax=marine metagenome TaxID=408172 RepID=A0A381P6X1_9ZZZZ
MSKSHITLFILSSKTYVESHLMFHQK